MLQSRAATVSSRRQSGSLQSCVHERAVVAATEVLLEVESTEGAGANFDNGRAATILPRISGANSVMFFRDRIVGRWRGAGLTCNLTHAPKPKNRRRILE